MRLDQLTVQLRARSPWEAMELGMALVRRHAGAIWRPWLWLSLPAFVLCNALAFAIGKPWLAGLAMWWLKPLFDRVPLYVVSRAVFGAVPDTAATLRAQARWGGRPLLHYLSWRRFSAARSLYLPIDLLEGVAGERPGSRPGQVLRERRRVLGGAVYGNGALLTLVCANFELALSLACVMLVFMFVPFDYLPETARAAWALVAEQPPWWALLGLNAVAWLATSVIEPFFVGAGFGLYLNRRIQIEAWDVEIVFRRLRARLKAAAAGTALALLLAWGMSPLATLRAQERVATPPAARTAATAAQETTATAPPTRVDALFGGQRVDDRRFRVAVGRAYQDPLLGSKRTLTRWEPIRQEDASRRVRPDLSWLGRLGALFAFLGEWGLWVLLALLILALLVTAPRWWPWMRGWRGARRAPELPLPHSEALKLPQTLPADIAAAARRLWREGQPRRALALLYRASVEAMAVRARATLVPGATEAECLRLSQRMPDAGDRGAFARAVRTWQYAAYGRRLPGEDEFESLLGELQRRFGWTA